MDRSKRFWLISWQNGKPNEGDASVTSSSRFLDPLSGNRAGSASIKEVTHRRAVARGQVHMRPETTSLVASGAVSKGDVLGVARVAAIQAAKRAADLLPYCHPVLVGSVSVNFRIEDAFIEVEVSVDTVDRTGVAMEAMTACSVACLSIYDMCKSADDSMSIDSVSLWEKTGGQSGPFRRPTAGERDNFVVDS